jgi:hypothetical protein
MNADEDRNYVASVDEECLDVPDAPAMRDRVNVDHHPWPEMMGRRCVPIPSTAQQKGDDKLRRDFDGIEKVLGLNRGTGLEVEPAFAKGYD